MSGDGAEAAKATNEGGARSGRKLGPGLAMMLVAGNMIGSGVYLLPATLAGVGSMTVLGWIAAGIGALVLALVFARLAVLRPGAIPMSLHARDAFGAFPGFQSTFLYWMSTWVGNVAIALAVAGYFAFFSPGLDGPWALALLAVGVLWLLTIANIFGAKLVARLEGGALLIGLAPVLAVGILGWFWFDPEVFAASWNVSGKPAFAAIPASVVLIFWAFAGLESASAAAAVVANPERDIPIATVGGVALAGVVYVAAMAAIMGLAPAGALAADTAPFATVLADTLGGEAGLAWLGAGAGALVAVCAMIKASATLGGWILLTAETAQAGAGAGYFPKFFRATTEGPAPRTLILSALLMSVVTLATVSPTLGEQFGALINVSVLFMLVAYVWSCLALWRFSRGAGARAAAAGGLLFSLYMTFTSDWVSLAWLGGFLALSVPLYFLARGAIARENAGGA